MIKAIIFDFDGVIIDSFPKVHMIYQIICKKLKKHCPRDIKDFQRVYGLHSRECYQNLGFTEAEVREADSIFSKESMRSKSPLFPGIKDVIATLHQKYTLTILSANLKAGIEPKLAYFDIKHYFVHIVGQEKGFDGPLSKHDQLPLLIEKLNVKKSEIIFIGDREVDYNVAKKAGLPHILLVEYGWGYDPKRIPKYNPKIKVHTPKDILKAVKMIDK